MSIETLLDMGFGLPFMLFYTLTVSNHRFARSVTLSLGLAVCVFYAVIRVFVPVWDGVARLDYLAEWCITALSVMFLTRQRLVQTLFVTASAYVYGNVVSVIAATFAMLTGLPALLVRLLLYGAMALFLYGVRRPVTAFMSQANKGWWLICSVPVFLVINFLFVTSVPPEPRLSDMAAALFLSGTSLISYITFIYIFRYMHKESQLEQNVIALRLFVASLENQNTLINQHVERNALFRHDLRHVTQMMNACLNNGDLEGARELLAKLNQEMTAEWIIHKQARITGHQLLDTTLSYYAETARICQIDITIRIHSLETVAADKTELAVVLANALENAIKACRELPEDRSRIVRLDGRPRGQQFFLEIANTCTGDVIFDPDSGLPLSKRKGHGLGCQSIVFFAEKNGAAVQFQLEGEWFHLRLLL